MQAQRFAFTSNQVAAQAWHSAALLRLPGHGAQAQQILDVMAVFVRPGVTVPAL